jgi:hypothetical protein
VGQTHLDIYSGYRKQFSCPMGIAAVKHAFNDTESPKDDDELTVYGVNSDAGELIYNTSRYSLDFFKKWDSGRFLKPIGVAADRNGWVAVTDKDANQIVILNNESNELRYVKSTSLHDTGIPLQAPSGLAMENGRLYIADTGNDRLVVMNKNGSFVESIGTAEHSWRLMQPFSVAVIEDPSWNHYQSEFMVVTDSLNQRLCKLSMDGEPLAVKRFADVSGGSGGFFFVAIDYYSNIYATDMLAGCVYKFDRHLTYLTRFGCGMDPETRLDSPRGIAIYRRFGQVFIAEQAGASYFWIGTDIIGLSCEGGIRGESVVLNIQFSLTEQSQTSIRLEDAARNTVHVFDHNLFTPPGRVTRTYQYEKQALPCPLAECKYYVTVLAKPTYSSKKFVEAKKHTQIKIKE